VTSDRLVALLALVASTGQISSTFYTTGALASFVQLIDSAAKSSARSLTITVAGAPPLSIITGRLPNGVARAGYAGVIQATGGMLPHKWSISSGQLPTGLSLDPTSGSLSSRTRVIGSYWFTLQAEDANSEVASSSFTLKINSAFSSPYTSRTDLATAPETIPALCSPAPCKMTSSDLNSNVIYLRVTGPNTPTSAGGSQYTTAGYAAQREWNVDATAFWVGTRRNGTAQFFTFNPSRQTSAVVACRTSAPCDGGVLQSYGVADTADLPFSTVSPYVAYGMHRGTIMKMDFSATVSHPAAAPKVTRVYSTSSCSRIPTTSTGPYVAMAEGDSRFISPLGNGEQDRWIGFFVYDTSQGCRWFNFSNMTVGGDWGPTGNANLIDPMGKLICSGSSCSNVPGDPLGMGTTTYFCSKIHDVRIDPSGRWVWSNNHCSTIGLNAGPIVFWDIATNNIYALGDTGGGVGPCYGGGHFVQGWNNIWVNGDTDYAGHQYVTRTLPPTCTTNHFLYTFSSNSDTHFSWNNQKNSQLQPVLSSFFNANQSAPSQAWQDELVMMSVDGSGIAYRIAHMYTRDRDGFAASGLGNVSRDGKWAIFCSDWGGTSRDDVFLVPLK
jgi:Putative Ig domain